VFGPHADAPEALLDSDAVRLVPAQQLDDEPPRPRLRRHAQAHYYVLAGRPDTAAGLYFTGDIAFADHRP
jgi:hypothetical protein